MYSDWARYATRVPLTMKENTGMYPTGSAAKARGETLEFEMVGNAIPDYLTFLISRKGLWRLHTLPRFTYGQEQSRGKSPIVK